MICKSRNDIVEVDTIDVEINYDEIEQLPSSSMINQRKVNVPPKREMVKRIIEIEAFRMTNAYAQEKFQNRQSTCCRC